MVTEAATPADLDVELLDAIDAPAWIVDAPAAAIRATPETLRLRMVHANPRAAELAPIHALVQNMTSEALEDARAAFLAEKMRFSVVTGLAGAEGLTARLTFTQLQPRAGVPSPYLVSADVDGRSASSASMTGARLTSPPLTVADRVELSAFARAMSRGQAVLDAIPDIVFELDEDGSHITFAGQTGSYVSPEQRRGRQLHEEIPVEVTQLFAQHSRHVLERGGIEVFEYALPASAPPEERRSYESRLVRGPRGTVAVVRDVTDRRRAEERLQEAAGALARVAAELERRVAERTAELAHRVKEREMLVREVHHRVKNNLQLVSSLLNLQSRKLGPGLAKDVIRECQTRVQAIALIHERLYQSNNLARIAFGDYVRTIANNVLRSASVSRIRLEVQADDIELSVEQAIPLGLVLNELLTNATKHAFPDGRPGMIHVRLENRPPELVLMVQDDGVGLPAGADPMHGAETLGVQLVQALAEQVKARVEIERDAGTTFRFFVTVATPPLDSPPSVS